MVDRLQTISHPDLIDALCNVPPLELKGVVLLREYHATGKLPEDRQQLIEATEELVAYTDTCTKTAHALASLEPIPAADEALAEGYPL